MKNKYASICKYCKKVILAGEGIVKPLSFREQDGIAKKQVYEFYHDHCYKLLTTTATRYY